MAMATKCSAVITQVLTALDFCLRGLRQCFALQGVARWQELDGPLTNHHMLTVRVAPMGLSDIHR